MSERFDLTQYSVDTDEDGITMLFHGQCPNDHEVRSALDVTLADLIDEAWNHSQNCTLMDAVDGK